MQCSPYNNDKFFKQHNTCFSKSQLVHLAEYLQISISSNSKKQDIWNRINEHMISNNLCDNRNEHCWLKYYPKQINNRDSTHVPQHPIDWFENPYSWLSNLDIMNVMVQYEKKYKRFKFIGVFPIDFASSNGFSKCVSEEMCNLKINSLAKKYSSFAAVFNLDKHYEPGSHWVAIFFNINKSDSNYGFYYFDSNAMKPPNEIIKFYESIKHQLKDEDFKLEYNIIQKQFKNTECGMFCIYFLTLCLKNISFEKIIKKPFNDEDVHKLRKRFFRKPNNHK